MSIEGEKPSENGLTESAEARFQVPEAPAPKVELEQEVINQFSRHSERLFGLDPRSEVAQGEARQFLNQSLTGSLVYKTAERLLRAQGITEPLDQVTDPSARYEAIKDATHRLSQASSSELQRLYGTNYRSLSEPQRQFLEEYRPELNDIDFCRFLAGVGSENRVRARLGLIANEYDQLSGPDRQVLVGYLNEINLARLAKEHDDQAQTEGRRGRVFGDLMKDQFSRNENWLEKLMKLNNFQEVNGLLVPEDMAPDVQEKYAAAFETYRQLFSEKGHATRYTFNEQQRQSIEEMENLLAQYEAASERQRQLPKHAETIKADEKSLVTVNGRLDRARTNLENKRRDLAHANIFNRGARQRAFNQAQQELQSVEQSKISFTNQLENSRSEHEKASNAPQEIDHIGRVMQNKGYSSNPEVTRQKLDELKGRPLY